MRISKGLITASLTATFVLSGCTTMTQGENTASNKNKTAEELNTANAAPTKRKPLFAFKIPSFNTNREPFFKPNSGPLFKLERHPSDEFIHDYRAVTDNGYALPAIPVDKMDKKFLRQRVSYVTKEKPGTIIVDVAQRFLYLVEPNGKAMRYGVGVGKAGFEWQGNAYVGWKQPWPKWTPPDEMIERKPELAKYSEDNGGMEPGLDNPLGARAIYLFQNKQDTLYRLHGTPIWQSIGTAASSGCIRLINQDIIDLYSRVRGNPKVVVKQ